MPAIEQQRKCLSCNLGFHGRADKKFCSDQCRNLYHNESNMMINKYYKSVNLILKRNRKILEELCPAGKNKVSKSKLATKNFNFNYITNIYRTSGGNIYYFCYEYGYLLLENDTIMVVLKKDFV